MNKPSLTPNQKRALWTALQFGHITEDEYNERTGRFVIYVIVRTDTKETFYTWLSNANNEYWPYFGHTNAATFLKKSVAEIYLNQIKARNPEIPIEIQTVRI